MSSKTCLVLVETVSMFRHRYVIETPESNPEWALDDVVMEDAEEMSQLFLGENIISHRVVSEEEAINVSDADNDYTREWPIERKKNVLLNLGK